MKKAFGFSVAIVLTIASIFCIASCPGATQTAPDWVVGTWSGQNGFSIGITKTGVKTGAGGNDQATFGVGKAIQGGGEALIEILVKTDTVFEIKTTAKIEGQTDVTKMKIVREGDAEPYAYKLYAQQPGESEYHLQGEITKEPEAEPPVTPPSGALTVPEWARGTWQEYDADEDEYSEVLVLGANSISMPTTYDMEAMQEFGVTSTVMLTGMSTQMTFAIVTSTSEVFEFSVTLDAEGETYDYVHYFKMVKEGNAEPYTYKFYLKDRAESEYDTDEAGVLTKKQN